MDLETLPLPGLFLTALIASGLLYLFSFSSPPSSTSTTTTTTEATINSSTTSTTPTTTAASTDETPHVAALWIYPIKSCRGISVHSAQVVATGLQHDRQFTFAVRPAGGEEGEWTFITQRQYPLLSRVSTGIAGEELCVRWPAGRRSWWGWGGDRTAGFSVGLAPPAPSEQTLTLRVRVWKDTVCAYRAPMPTSALSALHSFLDIPHGQELALCRVSEVREVFRCAPRKETLGWQVVTGFADTYPIHLLSLSSIASLGSLPAISSTLGPLSPTRFRANLHIAGAAAFDEDGWKRFSLGGSMYTAACRTVRCRMPNVDPETGVKHPIEPDRTMRETRCVDEGAKGSACLGLQVLCEQREGATVKVGDRLVVTERGAHRYIKQ